MVDEETPAAQATAAPPVADASRLAPPDDPTAVFGFTRSAPPEQTASYASAPPPPHASDGAGVSPVPPRPSRPRTAAAPVAARRPPSRWPWVVLVAALIFAALAAFWFTSRRPTVAATHVRLVGAAELLARDDRGSLELAVSLAASEPSGEARALQALALLWLAADTGEELAPLHARIDLLEAHLAREAGARTPGWQFRRDELASRLARARQEAVPLEDRERRLLEAEAAAEEEARLAGATEMALLRPRALRQALRGDAALDATVRQAAGYDASDPWVEMALGIASSKRGAPDLRGLESVSARHPRLLRARLLLARALHAMGRDGEALRILDEIIAENGDHESAKARKAEILAPPDVAVSRVDLGGAAPPRRAGGYLPRLRPRS
jgi:hypothetical protein